ncbi:Uncharacterized protein FKW44_005141 [Caligus rogercresseyi]|uniref:C2H2-type domain-containing protein n=1 Tax=Caligus rogercresseyi TaxID=217165 RepID=A0A7T8QRR0_CALRO|nr:Uncharacterized protein FKW44_005141 [Caligus rogercresseyi]
MVEAVVQRSNAASPHFGPLFVEVSCIPIRIRSNMNHPRNRVRSASVGRDKKSDLQARYWAFLFQNLRRAVDDLYTTCESDDSIPAAKEVLLILENYVRDFKNLTDWLRLKWDYENTPPPDRPTSLSWDGQFGSLLMTSRKLPLETHGVIKEVLSPEMENKNALPNEPCQTESKSSSQETVLIPIPDLKETESINKAEKPQCELTINDNKSSSSHDETSSTKEENNEVAKVSSPCLIVDKEAKKAGDKNQEPIRPAKSTELKVDAKVTGPNTTNIIKNLSLKPFGATPKSETLSKSPMPKNQDTTKAPPSPSKAEEASKPVRPRSSLGLRPRPALVKKPLPGRGNKPVFKPPSSNTGGGLLHPKNTNTTGPNARSKPSPPKNQQRLSLVARQGLKSSPNPKTAPPVSSGDKGPTRSRPVRSISNLVRPNIRKYNNSLGSNSSVHSSSSIWSWAETVKGSREEVDNLESNRKRGSLSVEDEEDGWKTVKSKSRSRNSLLNGSHPRYFNLKSRFKLPSSAASLPCLLSEEAPEEDSEKENKADNNHAKIKKTQSFSRKTTDPYDAPPHKSEDEDIINRNESEKVEIKELTEESVRAHNESLNVAIAKAEVAIAEAEEEEENLVREIIETEKAELTEDTDGDTDIDKRSDSASSTNEVASLASSSAVTAASTNTPPFEGLSWVEQIELEGQMESARYPGRAIQLHEKLSSPARKKEPHEAFKAHQEKHIRAQARRSKFQEEKANKLSALNTRILEVMTKKEILINERSDMILDKMRKAEVKRQEHIEGIRKKAHEEDAKLKEIAFINELQAQNARIEVMAQNASADEKCEGRLAELAEERAKKAEQREAKEARAEERRREMEMKRIKDVEALKERIRSREERIQEEQKQLRKDRIEERLSTVRAAEQGMKEELQEKIALKQEIAAKRHKERLEIIRTKAFELSVQRGLKDDDSSVPCLMPYEPRKKCEMCGVLIFNEVQLLSHIRGKLHTENVHKANEGRLLSKEEIQNCNLTRIVDVGDNELDPRVSQKKERSKNLKKKAKKIRHRLLTRGTECERSFNELSASGANSSPNRAKIGRALKDIEKLLNSQGKGSWPNSSVSTLERSLGEISRSFDKKDPQDQSAFYQFEGFTLLTKIFNLLAEQKNSCIIPLKSICCVARICSEACLSHYLNTEYLFMSNSLILIVEILRERLDLLIPEGKNEELDNDFHHLPDWPIVEPVAQSILDLLTLCLAELTPLCKASGNKMELISRAQDQISYIISIGIVDQLAGYFHKVQDSIDNKPEVGEFILSTLRFLSALMSVVEEVIFPDNPSAIAEDPTHLFATLRHTDLVGLVSMLYGMLLHQDRPPREEASDPHIKFPEHILKVAFEAARLLHRMVRTDLEMVQDVLGSEGISLEFRHIASYLLWYCLAQEDQGRLLHEIIILVGYFGAGHKDNQLIVKSGNQPSILQQLCTLPFPYFCQPSLKRILFPTLFACCHENKENRGILSEELNWSFIDDFVKTPDGSNNNLVQLVFSVSSTSAASLQLKNDISSNEADL